MLNILVICKNVYSSILFQHYGKYLSNILNISKTHYLLFEKSTCLNTLTGEKMTNLMFINKSKLTNITFVYVVL